MLCGNDLGAYCSPPLFSFGQMWQAEGSRAVFPACCEVTANLHLVLSGNAVNWVCQMFHNQALNVANVRFWAVLSKVASLSLPSTVLGGKV